MLQLLSCHASGFGCSRRLNPEHWISADHWTRARSLTCVDRPPEPRPGLGEAERTQPIAHHWCHWQWELAQRDAGQLLCQRDTDHEEATTTYVVVPPLVVALTHIVQTRALGDEGWVQVQLATAGQLRHGPHADQHR